MGKIVVKKNERHQNGLPEILCDISSEILRINSYFPDRFYIWIGSGYE